MMKSDDDLSEQAKDFLHKHHSDVFKGVDAKIHFAKTWNADQNQYITRYWWTGGEIAAISDELMAELHPNAIVGDELQLGDLRIVLTDLSSVRDFWYARRIV